MKDLIDRQAVKEWLAKWEGYIDADIIARMQYRIIDIPSAQPEPCEDTISRQVAIDAHYEYCNKHPDAGFPVWSLKILEDLPSAQLEIIRCRDCKYSDTDNTLGVMFCWRVSYHEASEDGFCSWAERRTDEGD